MHDHDHLQIHAVAMIIAAKDRIYLGPDRDLYCVIPDVMPETVDLPYFVSDGLGVTPGLQVMMTWRRLFEPGTKRYRIPLQKMEWYADVGGPAMSHQLDEEKIFKYAREWFDLYRPQDRLPYPLMEAGEEYYGDILP